MHFIAWTETPLKGGHQDYGRARAREVGIRDLLPKPVTVKVLGHVLDRLVRIGDQGARPPE